MHTEIFFALLYFVSVTKFFPFAAASFHDWMYGKSETRELIRSGHPILFFWNSFNAIGNGMMLISALEYVFLRPGAPKFYDIMCYNDGVEAGLKTQWWPYAFMIWKIVEMFDTVILIGRRCKAPDILHSWHHASVYVLTAAGYYYGQGIGIIFLLVNAFIHVLMYSYYAFMTIPRFKMVLVRLAPLLTLLQIAQMMIAICVIYIIMSDSSCDFFDPAFMAAATFIYGSYFILFTKYAYRRYIQKADVKNE